MSAVEVHVQVEGPEDAPVVVFSPSLGSTLAMWDAQAAALREHRRVVRYDPRGHGRSPAPPGPYELADLADDVVALLDRLGVPAVDFCGLSLGGMTGMQLAVHHPERIRRLVLCCTAAKLPPEPWADRAAAVRAAGTASIAGTVVQRWLTPRYAAAHPALVRHLEAMVESASDEGYAECCDAIRRMDLLDSLERVSAPTLVVAGRDDPATPPEHAERIAARIPGARLEVLAPAAHLANLEQAEALTALLLDHLDADGKRR
ncbi:MAG: 3-oxoadipate enol-lactonase [Actinomycetota bacterium]|nr:3-oxoadipate enol-lactonase [Actinomycetota bacterium]